MDSTSEKISLNFTKQEWTIIWNVLVRSQYQLGDALLVKPICDVIEPVVKPEEGKVIDTIKTKTDD